MTTRENIPPKEEDQLKPPQPQTTDAAPPSAPSRPIRGEDRDAAPKVSGPDGSGQLPSPAGEGDYGRGGD